MCCQTLIDGTHGQERRAFRSCAIMVILDLDSQIFKREPN